MILKPIKTEQEYEAALARLEEIFDAAPNTPEGDEAEILAMLIEDYEDKYHSIEAPDPIEAIKIRLEEMDLKQADLVGVIGGKSRVSEVLNRKRKLNVEMIRNLTEKLRISPAILVRDYELTN
jgi:HTH-type transcriptional regulator/antitoxin HigA